MNVMESQIVEVIETNLDDWSPEGFPHLTEILFARGALDVTLSPMHMKKGRPGFTLQVICPKAFAHSLKETILIHTSAIGLRFRSEERQTLPREVVILPTRWGDIKAKKVLTPAGWVVYPEYEECRRVAQSLGLPLSAVYNGDVLTQEPDESTHYGFSHRFICGQDRPRPWNLGIACRLPAMVADQGPAIADVWACPHCSFCPRLFCLRLR